MASLNLLPRKSFEILLDDKSVVRGQYSLWSVKRYCDKKKLSLAQLEEQLNIANISLDDIVMLILCAVEYTSRKSKEGFSYSDVDVCDWIEQLGGISSDNYQALIGHARTEDDSPVSEEKKSQLDLTT